jgi:hypothetical protein
MLPVALALAASVSGPMVASAADPAMSVPSPTAGRWQGRAAEVPGIYSGPAGATVALELRPDGTFTETWKDGGRQWSMSGTWRTDGKNVVLESNDPSRDRLSLRRFGDTLYTVATEPLPSGRTTTTAIELRPVS